MVKNAADVIFGAFGYYSCGYAFSFGGEKEHAQWYSRYGSFFINGINGEENGHLSAKYFFHLPFATTATTLVSGAMAERAKLKAYMLFSFLNFLSYVF